MIVAHAAWAAGKQRVMGQVLGLQRSAPGAAIGGTWQVTIAGLAGGSGS